MLCGHELPFVAQADHLGNVLTERGDMGQDAIVKRANFIKSAVETKEMFKWAAPAEVLKATKIHRTAFLAQVFGTWGVTRQVYKA